MSEPLFYTPLGRKRLSWVRLAIVIYQTLYGRVFIFVCIQMHRHSQPFMAINDQSIFIIADF